MIQDKNRTRAFHTEFTEIGAQSSQRRAPQEAPGPLVQLRLTRPMPPRHSTASASLLRSLCGNSVISVVNPSSFRFLSFELSTFNFELPSRNSNHSRTYESFSRNPNYSRTYGKHGGGGPSCKMSSPITPVFSFTMLTILLIAIVGPPTFPFLHASRTSWSAAARRRFCTVGTSTKVSLSAESGGPPQKDGPYTRRRNPRTDLKVGHYRREPRCRFRNAGATRLPLFSRLHL